MVFFGFFHRGFPSLLRLTHILRGGDKIQCLGVHLLPLGSGGRCCRLCGTLVDLPLALPSLAWLMISYLDGDIRRQVGRQTDAVIHILDYILLPFLWLVKLSEVPLELRPRSKEFEFICVSLSFLFPFVSFWMRQAVKTMNHSFSFITAVPN